MSIHGFRGIIASARVPGLSDFDGLAEYIADNSPRHIVTANGGVVSGNIPEWYSDDLSSKPTTDKIIETTDTQFPLVHDYINGVYRAEFRPRNIAQEWTQLNLVDGRLSGPFRVSVRIAVSNIAGSPTTGGPIVGLELGSSSQSRIVGYLQNEAFHGIYVNTWPYNGSFQYIETDYDGGDWVFTIMRDSFNNTTFWKDNVLLYTIPNDTSDVETAWIFAHNSQGSTGTFIGFDVELSDLIVDAGNFATTKLISENTLLSELRLVGTSSYSSITDKIFLDAGASSGSAKCHAPVLPVGDFRADLSFDNLVLNVATGSADVFGFAVIIGGGVYEISFAVYAGIADNVRRLQIWDGTAYTFIDIYVTSGTFTIVRLGDILYLSLDGVLHKTIAVSGILTDMYARCYTQTTSHISQVYINELTIDNGNFSTSKIWPEWFSDTFPEPSINLEKWSEYVNPAYQVPLTYGVEAGNKYRVSIQPNTTQLEYMSLLSRSFSNINGFEISAVCTVENLSLSGVDIKGPEVAVVMHIGGATYYILWDQSNTLNGLGWYAGSAHTYQATTVGGTWEFKFRRLAGSNQVSLLIDDVVLASFTNTGTTISFELLAHNGGGGSGTAVSFDAVFENVVVNTGSTKKLFLQSSNVKTLGFNGIDTYLSIPDSDDFYYDMNQFSFKTVLKLNSSPTNVFIYNQVADVNNYIQGQFLSLNSFRFEAYINSSLFIADFPVNMKLNDWTYLELRWDTNKFIFIKDGAVIGEFAYSGPMPNVAAPFNIGRNQSGGGSGYFDGNILYYEIQKYGYSNVATPFVASNDPIIPVDYTVVAINGEVREISKPSYSINVSDLLIDDVIDKLRWLVTEGAEPSALGGQISWVAVDGNRSMKTANDLGHISDFIEEVDWSWDNVFVPGSSIGIGIDALMATGGSNDIVYTKTNSTESYKIRINDSQTTYAASVSSDKIRFRRTGTTLYAERWNGASWDVMASGTNSSAYNGISLKAHNDDVSPTFDAHFTYVNVIDGLSDQIKMVVNSQSFPIWLDVIGTPQNMSADPAVCPEYHSEVAMDKSGLYFNGIDSRIGYGNTLLDGPTFTVMSIIRPISYPQASSWIWSQGYTGDPKIGLSIENNGSVKFTIGGSSETSAPGLISLGHTAYILVDYDLSGNLRVFLDGILVIDASQPIIDFTGSDVILGNQIGSDANMFNGYHFYHKFWNDIVLPIHVKELLFKVLINRYGRFGYEYEEVMFESIPATYEYGELSGFNTPPTVIEYQEVNFNNTP